MRKLLMSLAVVALVGVAIAYTIAVPALAAACMSCS